MRQLLRIQQEVRDPQEFIQNLKVGEVSMPEGVTFRCTPRDWSTLPPARRHPGRFRIPRAHRRRSPLRGRARQREDGAAPHASENGDIVEIVTASGHKPSRDWLNFVVTSHARYEIKYLIRREERVRAIDLGRKVLEKEARRFDLNIKTLIEDPAAVKALVEFGATKPDEIFALVGYGKLAPKQLLAKLVPPDTLREKAPEGAVASAVKRVFGAGEEKIKVPGIDDIMVFRARCCNPIRGEKIVGYITRGKGVSVHSATCPNVVNLLYDPERRIDVEWDKGDDASDKERAMHKSSSRWGGGRTARVSSRRSAPRSPTSTRTSATWKRTPTTTAARASTSPSKSAT